MARTMRVTGRTYNRFFDVTQRRPESSRLSTSAQGDTEPTGRRTIMPTRRAVGTNVLRKEGADKVTGRARYLDDLSFPNLLYGRTIRSTIPAGEIAGIRYDFDRSGFTIVDAHDIPGKN